MKNRAIGSWLLALGYVNSSEAVAKGKDGSCTDGAQHRLVRLKAHLVREVKVLFRHTLSGL